MATSIKDILLQVRGSTKSARAELEELTKDLHEFDGADAHAVGRLDISEFLRHVDEAEAKLNEIDHRTVTAKVKVRVDDVSNTLKEMRSEAEQLLQTRGSGGRFLPQMGRNDASLLLRRLTGSMKLLERGMDAAARTGQKLPKMFDDLSLTISRVYPALIGIVIIIGVSLVGALSAMAASLAAAVAGFGAMAAALVGALGPAFLIVLAVMNRFAKILEAVKLREAARTSAIEDGLQAEAKRQQALDAQAAAAEQLRDAIQSLHRAEEDYNRAVQDARRRIADQRESVDDSRRRYNQAVADAKEARVAVKDLKLDAMRAWQDAVERVTDAQLGLRDALLDVKDAQDNVGDAERDLNALLNALPEDKIGDVLQKLQDVNLDPDQANAFIQAAAGPGADPALAEKITDAQRRLERARLDLDQANNKVKDSETELTRAQQDNAAFTREGINAYQPYADALNRVHDANIAVGDAARDVHREERQLARLRDDGISRSPGVVAALRQIQDAHERIVTAQRAVRRASDQGRDSLDGMSAQAANAARAYGELSSAERRVVRGIEGIVGLMKGPFRGATDEFFNIIADGISGFGQLLVHFQGPLKTLAATMALGMRAMLKELSSPMWVAFFGRMIELATELAAVATPAFISLARIFRRIAESSGEQLVKLFVWLAELLGDIEEWTQTQEFNDFLKLAFDATFAWLELFRALSRIVFKFLMSAAGPGTEFVKWLTKGADALASWMDSEKGREELTQFFKVTMPLAKSIFRLLGAIGIFFLKLYEAVAPLLTGFFDGLTQMFKGLTLVASAIAKLTGGPLRKLTYWFGYVLGLMLGTKGLAAVFRFVGRAAGIAGDALFRAFVKIPRLLRPVLGLLDAIAGLLTRTGSRIAGFLATVGTLALGAGVDLVRGMADGVVSGVKWLVNAIEDIWDAVLNFLGIRSPSRLAADAGKEIVRGLVNGIKSLAGLVTDAARWLWDTFYGGITALAGPIADGGGWLIDKFVSGAKVLASTVADVGSWLWSQVWSGLTAVASAIIDAGHWLVDKWVGAVKAVASTVIEAGSWLWGKVWDGLVSVSGPIADAGTWLVDKWVGAIKSVGSTLLEAGTWIWGRVWDGLVSIVSSIVDAGTGIVNRVWDGIRGAAGVLGEAGGWLWGAVRGAFFAVLDGADSALDAGRGIVNRISDGIHAAGDVLKQAGGWVWGMIRQGLTAIIDVGREKGTDALEIGTKVIDRIWDGMKKAGSTLARAGRWVWSKIASGINSVIDVAKEKGTDALDIGKRIVHRIWDGVHALIEWIKEKAKSLGRAILNGVKEFLHIKSPSKKFEEVGGAIVDGLVKGMDFGKAVHFVRKSMGSLRNVAIEAFKHGLIDLTPGNILNAAKALGLSGLSLARKIGGKAVGMLAGLPKSVVGKVGGLIPGLASGALVTGASVRVVGEGTYDEAVLPLSDSIFKKLGEGIARAMRVSGPDIRLPGVIQPSPLFNEGLQQAIEQHFNLIMPDNGDGQPDIRRTAADLAREARRRGGFIPA